MKLVIDIDDDSIGAAGSYDRLPVWEDSLTIVCPNGITLTGRIDGWKHDGRSSKRHCGTARAARADK